MPTDADAALLERLDRIDTSLGQVRDSIDEDRDASREVTAALNKKIITAAEAVEQAGSASRRSNIAAVCAAVASLLAVAASVVAVVAVIRLKAVSDERADDAAKAERDRVNTLVVNCLNSNQARVDREARDEQLGVTVGVAVFDTLNEIVPPAATPEAAAARQAVIDKGKTTVEATIMQKARASWPVSLQPRDCSAEAVTNPSLVTPTPQPG